MASKDQRVRAFWQADSMMLSEAETRDEVEETWICGETVEVRQ